MTLSFPDDENGAVLRRMHENGDDLSKARNLDFTVVFAGEREAAAFSRYFRDQGYAVKCERSNAAPQLPWDVVVRKFMLPTHSDISAFEAELQEIADSYGGRNDGWGCFEKPSGRH